MMRTRGGVAEVRLELALSVLGVGMGGAGLGAGGEAGDGRLKMLRIVGVEVGGLGKLGLVVGELVLAVRDLGMRGVD